MKVAVDNRGYYGEFGGAFIPEMLYPNVEELRQNYLGIINDNRFKKEFKHLLKTYVGRPTPLYFAKRLSEKYRAKIYLKREDLCHTGAHKINNTIGQILLAKKLNKQKNYSGNRCGSTRCSNSYGLCADGHGLHCIYGGNRHGATKTKCGTHADFRS